MPKRSELEQQFEWILKAQGIHDFETEFRFAAPRRFRLDFAWPDERVGLELQGGVYSRGRHVRGAGYTKDVEKMNLAILLGWRVLQATGEMIRDDPRLLVEMIASVRASQASGVAWSWPDDRLATP